MDNDFYFRATDLNMVSFWYENDMCSLVPLSKGSIVSKKDTIKLTFYTLTMSTMLRRNMLNGLKEIELIWLSKDISNEEGTLISKDEIIGDNILSMEMELSLNEYEWKIEITYMR